VGGALVGTLGRFGLQASTDLAEMARGYGSLADAGARMAFIHTLRAVLDIGGQRVSALDRLYLAALMPSLIIWGSQDPLIPVKHATVAQRGLPNSRLEIFEDAGHFPQLHDPLRFALTLIDFLESSEPTQMEFTDEDFDQMRAMLLRGRA
jgi:pimeloyl-ACP methyl ester carboxylesterase